MRVPRHRLVLFALLVMAGVVLVDCHHATMSSPPPASPPPNPAPAATAAGETSTCPARQRALQLVASTPVETSLGAAGLAETQEVWLAMIEGARESLDIEQFYLANLPGGRLEPVVQAIERAAARGVRVRLIADASFADDYPATLARLGQRIAVRQLDLTGTMGGVQHAKLIIVDGCEIYLGSANFDWRSLEHIHELGLRVVDARLAAALGEVFELDWQLAGGGQPRRNTSRAWDRFPVTVTDDLKVRPAFSPRGWLPDERSWDLPQLVAVIDGAERSLRVQLLTYAAQFRDGAPFPTLDEALRRAARRGVTVRLLVSHWQQRPGRVEDVQALVRDGGVAVKLVTIPEHSGGFIPYARVIHAKVLVADDTTAWVGTSNWSGDYFHKSRNVGVVVDGARLAQQLGTLFDQLWDGPHAAPVDPDRTYPEPRIGP